MGLFRCKCHESWRAIVRHGRRVGTSGCSKCSGSRRFLPPPVSFRFRKLRTSAVRTGEFCRRRCRVVLGGPWPVRGAAQGCPAAVAVAGHGRVPYGRITFVAGDPGLAPARDHVSRARGHRFGRMSAASLPANAGSTGDMERPRLPGRGLRPNSQCRVRQCPRYRARRLRSGCIGAALGGLRLSDVDLTDADRVRLNSCRLGESSSASGRREVPFRCRHRCNAERARCGTVGCGASRPSSSSKSAWRRNATIAALSSSESTVDRGSSGPVLRFSTVARLRHFATAWGRCPTPGSGARARLAITGLRS